MFPQLKSGIEVPETPIEDLLQENQLLKQQLKVALEENGVLLRAISNLRLQLAPLHNGLKLVFGEIDSVGEFAKTKLEEPSSPNNHVWNSWKSKLGTSCAKVIDALMVHSEANTTQLSVITGLHRTTIPPIIFKLNKAGLINKNSGVFSLKKI